MCVNGPGPNGCAACGAPGTARPPQNVYPLPLSPQPLSEQRIREIIREELARAKSGQFDPMRPLG